MFDKNRKLIPVADLQKLLCWIMHDADKHQGNRAHNKYRIFLAIRRGFRPSRMTSNNLISPMKFCYNTNSTLPKQCQSSRSVLQDGSRTFGLFWKEKTPSYNRRNTVPYFFGYKTEFFPFQKRKMCLIRQILWDCLVRVKCIL